MCIIENLDVCTFRVGHSTDTFALSDDGLCHFSGRNGAQFWRTSWPCWWINRNINGARFSRHFQFMPLCESKKIWCYGCPYRETTRLQRVSKHFLVYIFWHCWLENICNFRIWDYTSWQKKLLNGIILLVAVVGGAAATVSAMGAMFDSEFSPPCYLGLFSPEFARTMGMTTIDQRRLVCLDFSQNSFYEILPKFAIIKSKFHNTKN